MIRVFLITFILNFSTLAIPKEVEVIFLSATKQKSTDVILKQYKKTAGKDDCVPMGDGCFHPQYGLMDPKKGQKLKPLINNEKPVLQGKDPNLKTFNAIESDMVDCKKDFFFDIFCGKAKAMKKGPSDLEVWIDTSSSMRRVDFSAEADQCYRRSFADRLKQSCDVDIATFDTSIKSLGSMNNLCVNYGLNDQKRIIDWIQRSNAKKLIVVTDIDEATREMRDYLFKIGAKVHGADLGDFDGKRLLAYISKISRSCKKPK